MGTQRKGSDHYTGSADTISAFMTIRGHLVNKRNAFLALAIATALVASACSGSESEGSMTAPTTASATTPTVESLPMDLPDLEFGKGEMPITVPSNFPMPQQTLISTTMIDGTRELTEVVFNISGNIRNDAVLCWEWDRW
jgi:hypothetical protein